MLDRLAQISDSHPAIRRIRRALLAAPLISHAMKAVDRRRLRGLERAGDATERAKHRWRVVAPDPGLTWGVSISGAAAVELAERYGVFGPGHSVLEVGPGYGRVLSAAIDSEVEFARYVGIDLSETNVAYLRTAFPDARVEVIHGDVESVTLEAPIDAAISFLTFKHLYPSFEAALTNLGRQLRAGGLVLFDLIEGSRQYFHRDGVTFMREYSRLEAAEIVQRAGLELMGFDQIEHAPGRVRLVVVARKPEA